VIMSAIIASDTCVCWCNDIQCQLGYMPVTRCPKLLAGIIIPPIPEKNPMQKIQTSPRFLRERRSALEKFINRVVSFVGRPL
jgi:PX domain